MSDESGQGGFEHFAATGGRITGVVGLVLAAALLVLWVIDHDHVPAAVAAGALVGSVLIWVSLFRPRVSVSNEELQLRNMLETIHVPLAAIDELAVRQVLAVRVGEKRYVSPAVGRKLRKIVRRPTSSLMLGPALPESLDDTLGPAKDSTRPSTDVDYADHVENRVRLLIDEARTRHGIRAYSDEAQALAGKVRRAPSWPEIVALLATTALFVLVLLL